MKKTAAAFVVGVVASSVAHSAPAFQTDWLVLNLENMFHVKQGELVPADWRFPTMPRLRYLGVKISGDVYAVYLKRVP